MLALIIILLGILSRVAMHLPNFTPIIPLALFGGVYLSRRFALWTPLVLMILSDMIIGFHDTILFTWGSILLISALGMLLRHKKQWGNLLGAGVVASILFFLVTNFGAWLTMYPRTGAGFINCYLAAIPFFRNTLLSTLFYTIVLFSFYEFVVAILKDKNWAKGLVS